MAEPVSGMQVRLLEPRHLQTTWLCRLLAAGTQAPVRAAGSSSLKGGEISPYLTEYLPLESIISQDKWMCNDTELVQF